MILITYLVVLNMITLMVFWLDKRHKIYGKTRIPESRLLTLVALGGTFGASRAMSLYNHKGRARAFRRHFAIITLIQLAAALYFFYTRFPPELIEAIKTTLSDLAAS
tara:strand:+ start:888 stop:1208 length:321 start_codon:yes stop_codon:yes gene_type:complete